MIARGSALSLLTVVRFSVFIDMRFAAYCVPQIILLKRPGHVVEGLHEETLKKEDDDKNNNGREVNSPEINREGPSHSVKHGFSGKVEDSNDGVVGVWTHPGDHSPGNNEPHVKG